VKAGGKQSCAFTLASLSTYSPTLKMETYSSEPLVDFQRTTLRYVSEILVCEGFEVHTKDFISPG
jgi:hypothetical protein